MLNWYEIKFRKSIEYLVNQTDRCAEQYSSRKTVLAQLLLAAHKLKSISSILHQPTCFKGTHDGVCQKPKEEIKEGNFNLDHNFKLYTYMHILNTYLI